MSASGLTAVLQITSSVSGIRFGSTGYSEVRLVVPHDMILMAKVFAVALAVGLDVLAISVGIGVARLPFEASLRLGSAFAGSEIAMQVIGYALGVGAGQMLGEVAT